MGEQEQKGGACCVCRDVKPPLWTCAFLPCTPEKSPNLSPGSAAWGERASWALRPHQGSGAVLHCFGVNDVPQALEVGGERRCASRDSCSAHMNHDQREVRSKCVE